MNKNGSTQITMIGDSAYLKIYTHIFLWIMVLLFMTVGWLHLSAYHTSQKKLHKQQGATHWAPLTITI